MLKDQEKRILSSFLKEEKTGNALKESYHLSMMDPFKPHMDYKKLKKIASAMAGATGAGIP